MSSEYRAFWNNKMWEVMQIDYRIPQSVILTDGTTDYLNTPLSEVALMRNTGKQDISGESVIEGDIIENPNGVRMKIRYGFYDAYCPADKCEMDSVGFYAEAPGLPQMPIGCLEDYAIVIGNIFENPELMGD